VTSIHVDDVMLRAFTSLPLGDPRPDTRLFVVDREGREVTEGEQGEIVIEGPSVGPGYLHDPELTARAFAGPRYRTGDAGHYRGRALLFDGRLDFQVKLFGHRIELDDVAANLRALPAVDQAAVMPVMLDGRCEALAGFVVLRLDATVTPAELRDQLARRVPAYMVPRTIHIRATLPMSVNGKVDRGRLLAEVERDASLLARRPDRS
jgi:D-alanine--poly(phosphoribitol) ligase subunit 1